MKSLSEEEDHFFEAREDITSVSDSSSECHENLDSDYGVVHTLPVSTSHDAWNKNLGSINERRNKFLNCMGMNVDETMRDDYGNASAQEVEVETDRMTEHSGAVLRSSSLPIEENFLRRIRNLDDVTEFILDEHWQDGLSGRIHQFGSDGLLTAAEFERSLGLSPQVQQVMRREAEEASDSARKSVKMEWLRRLGAVACIVDRQVESGGIQYDEQYHIARARAQMFNPMDDDSFISGSIDGKVLIWAIPGCQVIDCNDITEIVAAVCYRPDGKVWSWYLLLVSPDNHLRAQVCLQGKKKSPFKRITGFQFSPSDPTRLMVTSAASQISILDGVDVICKYRASEDSNVYVWNYASQDGPVPHVKNNWACERFFSNNASVTIPWSGITCGNFVSSNISGKVLSFKNTGQCSCERMSMHCKLSESSECKLPFSSPDHFSLSHGFFVESLPRGGSVTWPQENLPSSLPGISSKMCKSHYTCLKTSCQTMHGSLHAWGLVIVTGGWDGRIKWFQNYGLPICL
ncbi:hypothetical protein GH714_038383 [Hevea brasiliensis]|uniref:Uncharacterized protein n=1 Tax=Hevea brasiliensis TaxID=3981 RepID=A0A6A6MNB8_HEVBR|nr:hypothetical protein GH714_038383 [Hevea brasiliensis]